LAVSATSKVIVRAEACRIIALDVGVTATRVLPTCRYRRAPGPRLVRESTMTRSLSAPGKDTRLVRIIVPPAEENDEEEEDEEEEEEEEGTV